MQKYCKTIIDNNIKNMTNWYFVNKYCAELPQEMYCYIMDFVVELPKGNYDETKCNFFHFNKCYICKECNITICRTHTNVWNCLPCDLILCKECFYKNGHAGHTSWACVDYEI